MAVIVKLLVSIILTIVTIAVLLLLINWALYLASFISGILGLNSLSTMFKAWVDKYNQLITKTTKRIFK